MYTPAHTFAASYFTMTPLCGYTLEYQIQIKDLATGTYTPLPAWLSNTGNLDFSVYTDDPANVGDYSISIIGSVPGMYMDPAYSEELILILHVENKCLIDEVTPLSTIDYQLYYIVVDG